jgi:hypothetical protein
MVKLIQFSKTAKYRAIPKYRISLPARERHSIMNAEIMRRPGETRRDKAISVMRSLQYIVNLNPSMTSDKVMKRDMNWLRRHYRI